MSRFEYRGVRYRRIDSDSIIIERQIVDGIKIPEIEVNVKFEGQEFTVETSFQYIIRNLLRSRQADTKTGEFYDHAYDESLEGEINFREYSSDSNVGATFGVNRIVNVRDGKVVDFLGDDYVIDINVNLAE